MNKYYIILNLRPGATEAEIKKAYRRKAFEFHPDRNKAPGAHEKFIEITIAYEALLNGKQFFTQAGYSSTPYSQQTPDPEAYKKWQQQAKERAEEQAKRRYAEYKKKNDAFKRSWYFPIVQLFILSIIFACGSVALLFFSAPVLVITNESESWPMSLLSLFWVLPGVWLSVITWDIWKIYRVDFT